MKISILTLFPEMFSGPFSSSILKHAQTKGLVTVNVINIRDFGIGTHKVVDDTPFGGGTGMVMRVDVLKAALDAVTDPAIPEELQKKILLTADGATYNQRTAERFSNLEHLILLCGHYEGVDERIKEYVDEEISIGDFVLTGGEIPSMLIVDSVVRLLPGVLKEGVTDAESFSHKMDSGILLEYPHYTKPRSFDGIDVPEILLSGDHRRIDAWRLKKALEKTKKRRPDLLKND